MPEALLVLCTCAKEADAGKLAEALVGERLAACVNVLPQMISIYRWKGSVTRDQEVLLLIKTAPERFEALEMRIKELHTYEVPEIIAVPIVQGSQPYLEWLQAETRA